jgi:hypothetical protein
MIVNNLTGIWLLKHRDEVNSEEEVKISIKGKEIKFDQPEIEILYFPEDTNIVYQMGVRKRTEQERIGLEDENPYEDTYCFPGEYDINLGTIFISEPGKFELKDNGQIYITQSNEDYVCQEVWERMEDEESELIDFIKAYFADI